MNAKQSMSLKYFFDRKMIVLIIALLILDVLMITLGPPTSLDLKLYYTGEEARTLLAGFSEADWNAYFVNEVIDLGFIFVYATALLLALQRIFSPKSWTMALPLIMASADFIETSVIIAVLKLSVPQTVFDWLGVFTLLKWSFGVLVLCFVVVGLFVRQRRL